MNKQARGLVSKETVVLRRWGRETRNVDLSSELTRSNEGLTLETSAFNLFPVASLPYQLS